MKALFITAALFVLALAGGAVYLLAFDARHEYDLRTVLPIDTRNMPKTPPAPKVAGQAGAEPSGPVTAGRAETPDELLEIEPVQPPPGFAAPAAEAGAASRAPAAISVQGAPR